MLTKNILDVKKLNVKYGESYACRDISFEVPECAAVCLIGESGSGKTTTLSAITGLLSSSAVCQGELVFDGHELGSMPLKDKRKLLGSQIVTIFQNPESYLDPIYRVGRQMEDYFILQNKISRKEANTLSKELLTSLSFDNPEKVLNSYPIELSGGMCQRVSIAMILGCAKAKLILADEPTSALDQIIRTQTADLIKKVKEKLNASLLLVTHDIKLAEAMSDYIGVMYKGKLVEWGTAVDILKNPRHLYTQSLIAASPRRDTDYAGYKMYHEESTEGALAERLSITETHWILDEK
ncbi:ABC transporter ATP-binding protein [Butyrivibrio sp. WCD3002]|uniref:ABC transporter ATP-binding protein n=1 Tax=Butyrivibrio sp. WCD3002 TaxID=1280676 RepID=UPI00040A633E|nr:ABC transporter ATP-binding protein [Butyrivibrio sp. WCD3002]